MRPPPTRPPLRPLPLWPFLVAALVLVAIGGSIAFVRRNAGPEFRVSDRVRGTPTPTAERAGDAGGTTPAATRFLGSGSWTLSSLPDCLRESELRRGPAAALRSAFPRGGTRIAPGSVVRAGSCTIDVGARDLRIERGADRLHVPPEARLYRDDAGLTLVYVSGTQAEIRRYDSAGVTVRAPGAKSVP